MMFPRDAHDPRGNKTTKWWICQQCQSRWARLQPLEVTPRHGVAQDKDLVIFGKHAGSTYAQMLQREPLYSDWVRDTVRHAVVWNTEGGQVELAMEGSEHLQRLAQYIHSRRIAETFEAADSDLDM